MKLTPRQFGAVPPPGGLQAVMQRGRDLRRRRALVGTGAGAAVVVIAVAAALAVSGGSTNQSLEYAGPTPSATPTSMVAAAPTATVDAGAPGSAQTPAPRQAVDCVNNDCNEQDDPPGVAFGGSSERPSYTEHPTSSIETKVCIDAGHEPVSDGKTCVYSDSPQEVTVRRGTEISMPMRLCVASNASGPVTYHFPSGGEHDVRVEGRGIVWSFAASVRFTGTAHDVQLLPRQCRGYTTTWRTTDQRGNVLPAGDYIVNLRSLATTHGSTAYPDDEKGLPFFQLHLTD